jgi:hypothetical protein
MTNPCSKRSLGESREPARLTAMLAGGGGAVKDQCPPASRGTAAPRREQRHEACRPAALCPSKLGMATGHRTRGPGRVCGGRDVPVQTGAGPGAAIGSKCCRNGCSMRPAVIGYPWIPLGPIVSLVPRPSTGLDFSEGQPRGPESGYSGFTRRATRIDDSAGLRPDGTRRPASRKEACGKPGQLRRFEMPDPGGGGPGLSKPEMPSKRLGSPGLGRLLAARVPP